MRSVLKAIGTALLFAAVALCFAPTLVPPFLDRIYYRGPVSDHFDGQRFFNPDTTSAELAAHAGGPKGFLNRWISGDRAEWPEHVPVTPTIPAARVAGEAMRVTWIGHSTVLIQTQGLNILTDPIWSERASPFASTGPKRVRAPGIRFDDLPRIDLVLISHNHYDHMDLKTLKRLWDRDRPRIVTSLGNDTILREAGIGLDKESPPTATGIMALDWGQGFKVMTMCKTGTPCPAPFGVAVLRNHHWSSRAGTDRNRALWSAFVVKLPGGAIFYAGDTGYGDGGWVREAAANGPIRLAILPIGAYEPRDFMQASHIDPAEAMRIFAALDPAAALGVHWGTFQLTFEPIDDPVLRLDALKAKGGAEARRFVTTEAGAPFDVPPLQGASRSRSPGRMR